jgi:hypothetical protein
MSALFALSKYWKGYDVFARQKMSTFKSSRPAVLELAARYKELALGAEKGGADGRTPEQIEQAERILFSEMCEICLWGNATDLSLLTSLTYEDIQKLQGSQARKAAEKNILVNDLDAAFDVLQKTRKEKKTGERRVDIVLDNSGFELFVDLILAGYLLSAGLATTVVLHPKLIPWFVSDVTPPDFRDLIMALADPQCFYTAPDESGREHSPLSDKELSEVKFLFEQWSQFHAEGKLVIRPHAFWTSPGSYWRMPNMAKDLFEDLQESELVLFKGDLNYRKLASDVSSCLPPISLSWETQLIVLSHRLNGTLPPPSRPPSAQWVLNPASVFSPSGPARPMSLSDCPQVKTRDSASYLAVGALSLESGHGVESGLLYRSLMERPDLNSSMHMRKQVG